MFASNSVKNDPAITTMRSVPLGPKIISVSRGIWTMQIKDESLETQDKCITGNLDDADQR